MQVGSLVVCVDAKNIGNDAKPLVKGKIYTVREFTERVGEYAILLEELVNPIALNGEIAYRASRFRELDTPKSIELSEILELELV